MTQSLLQILSDIVTESHTQIQQDFANIDPIVGVSRSMRKSGVPADTMTIDCLKSKKRIIIVLHDLQPDIIHYQFSYIDKDPDDAFESMNFSEVTKIVLYDWIREYFS